MQACIVHRLPRRPLLLVGVVLVDSSLLGDLLLGREAVERVIGGGRARAARLGVLLLPLPVELGLGLGLGLGVRVRVRVREKKDLSSWSMRFLRFSSMMLMSFFFSRLPILLRPLVLFLGFLAAWISAMRAALPACISFCLSRGLTSTCSGSRVSGAGAGEG